MRVVADRPLRILVIADAKIPVPPDGYGGTERIVALLCDGLAARGHRVTLMAAKGSRDYGRLITHPWAGPKSYPYRVWCKIRFQVLSLWVAGQADLVINFGRVDYLASLLRTSKPLICQFGNPIEQHIIDFLLTRRRDALALVSVSDQQRAHLAKSGPWRTIYNGIDVDRFDFQAQPHKQPYLAFLGLLTRDKEADVAIQVARASGIKLKVAGKVPENDGSYFATKIRPHLDPSIEYVGEVNDAQKVSLLRDAAALINPAQWNESFGIVVPEAFACGTPVVAMRRASMPELIRHGITGFLCRSADEMVDAVGRLGEIDRRACREDCERRFSADRMVEEYVAAARDLLTAPRRRPAALALRCDG